MPRALLTSFLFFVPLAMAQAEIAEPPQPIMPEEVRDHLDERVVVTMEVRASKYAEKRKTVFLDSEEDFRDPKNLGITIGAEGIKELKEKKGIDSPADHFRGRTIRVRGTVTKMEERFYIHIEKAEQLETVDRK